MRPTEIKLSKKAKILIVEDDHSQRQLLVKLIGAAFDCDLLEASDGLQALKIMLEDKQKPDLVILDLMLPHLNGVEFLNIIRGRPAFDHVPIIVCSAVAETTPLRGSIGDRIQSYLVKPIDRAKLLDKLLAALHGMTFRVDYAG